MNMQRRDFLLSVIVAAAVTPSLGQEVAPAAVTPGSGAPSIASIPDFSGTWAHPFLNALSRRYRGPVR